MTLLEAHTRAQALMADVLASVPDDGWQRPTTCTDWTVLDLAGHVTWGRDLVRLCAAGEEIADRTAAPGAPRPADYLTGEPVDAFRAAWQACDAALTEDALTRPAPAFVRQLVPEATLGHFLASMVSDLIAHAWDIADALGQPLEVPSDVLAVAEAATAGGVPRAPGLFGDEQPAPADASAVDAYLAYLGRVPLA